MAPHSTTLDWKIPWAEEPGGLQSLGSLRIGHDWATSLSLFTFMHWRRKWQPTPVFLPGEPRDGGAWWAAVYGVTQSRTRLKRLSSSSSSDITHPFKWFLYINSFATNSLILEHFIIPKRSTVLTSSYFLSLLLQTQQLATTNPLSVSVDLPILDV